MHVNEKTRLRVSADLRPEIADALRLARKTLGLTQTELGQILGASQGSLTRWERGIDSPPISAITMMAAMVPDDQKPFWVRAGAISPGAAEHKPEEGMRYIPVLRDSAAAGTPRAVDEREVDYVLPMARKMLPHGGKLFGLKVDGDSMSPFLETGYVAIVDVAVKKPHQLAGRMVAARDRDDGVTIKWLREQAKDLYLLVPNKTSLRHQIQIMRPEGEWSIVGEVLLWVGQPPAPKRK